MPNVDGLLFGTLLAVGGVVVAPGARAEVVDLRGTDALFEVTTAVLALPGCGGPDITYVGGGSGIGESAIRDEKNAVAGNLGQVIAPMSRFLRTSICTATGSSATAEGYVIGLDGISVVRNKSNESGLLCAGVARGGNTLTVIERNGTPGIQPSALAIADGGTYTFAGSGTGATAIGAWADALRVLYAGLHHDGSKDCASDVRHALIRDWTGLFEDSCTGTEGCTNGIKHAYRRADASGTADTFATLIGIGSAATAATWCNGNERQDRDPVRVNCDALDDACQKCTSTASTACDADPLQRGLGVVLAIRPPEDASFDGIRYANTPCAAGAFKLASADSFSGTLCPNGGPKIGTQCWAPVDAAGNFGCVASGNSWPVGTPTATRLSGGTLRVYNRVLRRADGTLPLVPGTTSNWSAWYKQRVRATNTATCTEPDATSQIACLVSRDPCNVGFAGREATLLTNVDGSPKYTVDGILVDGIDASKERIRDLLTGAPTVYPLARMHFLSSLRGFGNIGSYPNQSAAAACFADRSKTDRVMLQFGYITLDDTGIGTAPLLRGAEICK